MNKILFLGIAISFITGQLISCGNTVPGTVNISGKTIACAQELPGVTITLNHERFGSFNSTTDSKGNFRFNGVLDGEYSVKPQKEGYSFIPEKQQLSINGQNALLETFEAYSTWARVLGGYDLDGAYGLVMEPDCGCTVAGYSDSFGNGSSDIWIINLDIHGDVRWEKIYKNETNDETDIAYSIRKTSDNGYIVAGYSTTPDNLRDFRILKLDRYGNREWDRYIGDEREDIARSIYQTSDGGFIAAGYSWSGSDSSASRDALIIKLSAAGELERTRMFDPGESSSDFIESIIQTSHGEYLFTGHSNYFNDSDRNNLWAAKLDSELNDGIDSWQKTYNPGRWNESYSIVETGDGGFATAGLTRYNEAGLSDCFIMKMDEGGHEKWSLVYGGVDNDAVMSIARTSDNGFIAAGYTVSYKIDGSDSDSDRDFLILKLDAGGKVEWDRVFSGEEESDDMAYAIGQAPDGGYIAAGSLFTFEGADDVWVLKLDRNGDIHGEIEGMRSSLQDK